MHEGHPNDEPIIHLIPTPVVYVLPRRHQRHHRTGGHARIHSTVVASSGIKGE